jgi:hypothetical protein
VYPVPDPPPGVALKEPSVDPLQDGGNGLIIAAVTTGGLVNARPITTVQPAASVMVTT